MQEVNTINQSTSPGCERYVVVQSVAMSVRTRERERVELNTSGEDGSMLCTAD
jgi:hypothetical protein